MNVQVVGRRVLIEPPELGDCGDRDCRTTVAVWAIHRPDDIGVPGKNVLLVAEYCVDTLTSGSPAQWIRVCAACDERRLRAWLADG